MRWKQQEIEVNKMKCGHPDLAVIFFYDMHGDMQIYCVGCLLEKSGLKPVKVMPKETVKRLMTQARRQRKGLNIMSEELV